MRGQEFIRFIAATLDGWLKCEHQIDLTDRFIERAIIHEYSKLLHAAVGQRDTPAWDRALTEIWNYITPMIRKIVRDDELAHDVAMDVLIKVCERHSEVQAPGAFLGWCAVIARREAVRAAARAASRTKRETPISALIRGDSDEDEEDALDRLRPGDAGPVPPDPDQDQRLAALEATIRECLRRMRHGAEVYIGTVLHDLSAAELARKLCIAPGAVYVALHRARARLKKCPQLLQALREGLEE
jgi:RNA polymerase sigma factor (sigma-70 family)